MNEESNTKELYVLVPVSSNLPDGEEARALISVCMQITLDYINQGWSKLPICMEEPDIIVLSFQKGIRYLVIRVRTEYVN